jgi:hypothetical protein
MDKEISRNSNAKFSTKLMKYEMENNIHNNEELKTI